MHIRYHAHDVRYAYVTTIRFVERKTSEDAMPHHSLQIVASIDLVCPKKVPFRQTTPSFDSFRRVALRKSVEDEQYKKLVDAYIR